MRRARIPWLGMGMNAWSLGLEASAVIGLRMMKLAAGGPAGAAEAQRMVSEKFRAAASLQSLALRGGLGLTASGAASKTLTHYRRKVRANRRRLTKG
ncbi:MAG TPA: hypothetical protein VIJ59_00830 [Caulobacteraceae bacterium]